MHVGSLALMLFLLPAYLGALRARLDGRCGVVSGVVEDSPGSSVISHSAELEIAVALVMFGPNSTALNVRVLIVPDVNMATVSAWLGAGHRGERGCGSPICLRTPASTLVLTRPSARPPNRVKRYRGAREHPELSSIVTPLPSMNLRTGEKGRRTRWTACTHGAAAR